MKKLIVMAALMLMATASRAASVYWGVSGTAAQSGYTVYLLTSIAQSYESVSDLVSASVGTGTIAKAGRFSYEFITTSTDDAINLTSMADAYLAIITSTTAEEFYYLASDLSAATYDVQKQESAPTSPFTTTASALLAGTKMTFGEGGDVVPEPTSGMLLLVGCALLALKRKRA